MSRFLTFLMENKSRKHKISHYSKTLHEFLTAVVIANNEIYSLTELTDEEFNNIKQKISTLISKIKINRYTKNRYLKEFANNPNSIKILVSAISAAQAILKKFNIDNTSILNVYLTGNKWHKDIQIYKLISNDEQINMYGIKNFNSSDIVITTDTRVYGISLKSANTEDELPTLINPSLFKLTSTIKLNKVDDSQTLENKLKHIIYSWFIETVKNNLDKFVDEIPDKCWNKNKKNEYKQKLSSMNIDTFVNTFNSILMSKTRITTKKTVKEHTREIVNTLLGDKVNSCFQTVAKLCTQYSDDIVERLLAIIFRPSLSKLENISQNELNKILKKLNIINKNVLPFSFALCTGFQKSNLEEDNTTTSKNTIKIIPGKCETTKEFITTLSKFVPSSTTKYQLVLAQNKKSSIPTTSVAATSTTDPAKIFLDLIWTNSESESKSIVIANLEIRYKGEYTPSPQFQGTLSQQFLNILHNK